MPTASTQPTAGLLLTVDDVAASVGADPRAVHRATARGWLKGVPAVGGAMRVWPDDFKRWVDGGMRGADLEMGLQQFPETSGDRYSGEKLLHSVIEGLQDAMPGVSALQAWADDHPEARERRLQLDGVTRGMRERFLGPAPVPVLRGEQPTPWLTAWGRGQFRAAVLRVVQNDRTRSPKEPEFLAVFGHGTRVFGEIVDRAWQDVRQGTLSTSKLYRVQNQPGALEETRQISVTLEIPIRALWDIRTRDQWVEIAL